DNAACTRELIQLLAHFPDLESQLDQRAIDQFTLAHLISRALFAARDREQVHPSVARRDTSQQWPQVVGRDFVAANQDLGLFGHIAQFADVARPAVPMHEISRVLGQPLYRAVVLLRKAMQKAFKNREDVLLAVPQRRNIDDYRAQPIVEVFAEATFPDFLGEV